MVKTTKAVVESDFDYLIKNSINKKYGKVLKKQFKTGNIRLQVSYRLALNDKTGSELDGELWQKGKALPDQNKTKLSNI